jgi:Pectate lyase
MIRLALLTRGKEQLVRILIGALLTLTCGVSGGATTIPAFPGAEGFGANTVGGRGGKVIEVSNLNDSGAGSLRAALTASGPRIVVFRTGGSITLLSQIKIIEPYLTVAGQSAQGGGITVRNDPSNIQTPLRILTHDVVIRYIRTRPGPSAALSGDLDAFDIDSGYNIVVDHCSFSWATDEVLTFGWSGSLPRPHDVTIQWSIVSEALNHSTQIGKNPAKDCISMKAAIIFRCIIIC